MIVGMVSSPESLLSAETLEPSIRQGVRVEEHNCLSLQRRKRLIPARPRGLRRTPRRGASSAGGALGNGWPRDARDAFEGIG